MAKAFKTTLADGATVATKWSIYKQRFVATHQKPAAAPDWITETNSHDAAEFVQTEEQARKFHDTIVGFYE